MNLLSQKRRWMYETMAKSRRFDDTLNALYMEGKTPVFDFGAGPLPGELHPSNGQEPCAVGICAHLRTDDSVVTSHRPHHVAVAKGVNLSAMASEILGKKTGLSGGRGGHMHIYDKAVNFSSSGIIAEGLGPAAGLAFVNKRRGTDAVAVAYIGDGAANQGAFHEVLNLASLWKLPFICVIEDNGWAVTVPKSASTSIARNSDRAASYGMPGYHVSGNDPDLIFDVAGEAIARARAGEGPALIEIETTRLLGHFIPDTLGYLSEHEKAELQDMNVIYRARLLREGVLSEDEADAIDREVTAEVAAAFDYAFNSAVPNAEDALAKVFA
jgi:pyruvate dehydrogenase E1 component alpha subunit